MLSFKNTASHHRLLSAMRREPVDATPIWIMRQAGRYLPEYRATRERAGSFMTLCQTPALACEVTLQPLARYPLDAAIIFSDILTIPDAMGLGLSFIEGQGPVFAHPVQTAAAISALTVPDPAQLAYVYDAIRLVQHELNDRVPLIGFAGSPWTLAAYMIEGKSQSGFPLLLKMKNEDPQLLHQLLQLLADAVSSHLRSQIEAGVQAVQLFDTWGGILSTPDFEIFSLHYLQYIVKQLKGTVPIILFTKGGCRWLSQIAQTGCDVVAVDWEISLKAAADMVGSQVALQGNMHPATLLQSPELIYQETARILENYGKPTGHIFNLGHGITPDVPPEHVAALVDAVHTISAKRMKEEGVA